MTTIPVSLQFPLTVKTNSYTEVVVWLSQTQYDGSKFSMLKTFEAEGKKCYFMYSISIFPITILRYSFKFRTNWKVLLFNRSNNCMLTKLTLKRGIILCTIPKLQLRLTMKLKLPFCSDLDSSKHSDCISILKITENEAENWSKKELETIF